MHTACVVKKMHDRLVFCAGGIPALLFRENTANYKSNSARNLQTMPEMRTIISGKDQKTA
jgi:hypothetical protein